MNLTQHPLSAAFPAMQGDEYQSLKDSIESIGVQNPITLLDGMVIDGWHRYTAAADLGVDCPTVDLGDVDPRDFVLAQNKARRNLTASQRAEAVVSVYSWAPAHRPINSAPGADLTKTTKQLADIAQVGTRTIEQAKAAHKAGLGDAVKEGALTAKEAAKIASGKTETKLDLKTAAPEDDGPNESEVAAQAASEKADREVIEKLLDSSDALATAYAEITRLNAVNAQLQQRLNGLMNEKSEAIKLCKLLQRRLDFAQKAAA